MIEVNPQQWTGIVDLANVTLYHDFHDVHMSRPDLEVNMTVGEDGFQMEVVPAKSQGVTASSTPDE